MDVSNSVGLSALLTLERRLTTVAHNVANASTAGFRAEEIRFDVAVSETAGDVSFSVPGKTYISREAGPIKPTGNPLDVAIQGDYWFGVDTAGGRAYTRDGRLHVRADGTLVTTVGAPVLDVGGSPLRINPRGGPPKIASDGMITQAGKQLGAIGLFRIPPEAHLERREGSAVVPDSPAEPVVTFTDGGIVQGHVEGSNVNAMQEIVNLVSISRAFEAINSSLESNSSSQKSAIRTLGGAG